MTAYAHPEMLVETNWLADNLTNTDLRIFDCAAQPVPQPDADIRKKYPMKPVSGRPLYQSGHIPGAGFIDIVNDLTDHTAPYPLKLAPMEQIRTAFAAAGIGNTSQVVLYSSAPPIWAARVWWTLRSIGFDNVAILNGGFAKWQAEGREIQTGDSQYPPATLTATPKPDVFVDRHRVRAALDEPSTLIVHALTPAVFAGDPASMVFGRPGRIPGSVNIPAGTLHDPKTGTYLTAPNLAARFDAHNSADAAQIITYCGGGINGSNDAFALTLLGYDNVSVYDGSMNEWGNDHTLPIEV